MTKSSDLRDIFSVRWAYDQLLLEQPHIEVDGVWTDGTCFYIVCPKLNDGVKTRDGSDLATWFRKETAAWLAPLRIVATPPTNGERLPERTAEEIAELRSAPRTVREVYTDLVLLLPNNFPEFTYDTEPPAAIVRVARPLAEGESTLIAKRHREVCPELRLEIRVDAECVGKQGPYRSNFVQGDISLMPSVRLPSAFSKATRTLCEQDEDFWIDERLDLFSTPKVEVAPYLPDLFTADGSRCLVQASVFPTLNIRTYLSLFRTAVLVMPLDSSYESALVSLQASERDLVHLATRGRLAFLMPQSIERYPARLLNELSNKAPESLLLSRRLAAATIADTRRRLPLLFPPLGSLERHRLLKSLAERDPATFAYGTPVHEELSRMWFAGELAMHRDGAMATNGYGLGSLVAALYKQLTERDLFIELSSAGTAVSWAAAIGATVFPIETETYSEQVACEMCASLYSGVRLGKPPAAPENLEAVLDGLLLLDNDAPVKDVADAFSHRDTDQLYALVQKIASANVDPDYLRNAIKEINGGVERFDRRAGRFERMDVLTLGGLIGSAADSRAIYVTLAAFLLNFMLNKSDPGVDFGGKLFDLVRALATWSSSDVVLVSRLRGKVRKATK